MVYSQYADGTNETRYIQRKEMRKEYDFQQKLCSKYNNKACKKIELALDLKDVFDNNMKLIIFIFYFNDMIL